MSQVQHAVPYPRTPYEQAADVPRPRPPLDQRPAGADAAQAAALVARIRAEQRKVKRWMVAGVITLAALLVMTGYAIATRQVTSHLETMGPVVFLTCIANLRLTARKLARLRAAEARLQPNGTVTVTS